MEKMDEQVKVQLISHLTTEISTLTNMKNSWRLRVLSLIYVGPFIVFGSIFLSPKGFPSNYEPSFGDTLLFIFLGLSWIFMGWLAGKMENVIQEKCNKFRTIIFELATNKIELENWEDSNALLYKYKIPMQRQYFWVYLLQGANLAACIILIHSIFFK